MYRLHTLFVALLFSSAALAQTGAGANVNASASQNTSVSANQSGAQAQSNTSVNTGSSAQASHDRKAQEKHGSQTGPANASGSGQLASGTMINAELVKPVDARKNKPGDSITAKTTQDVKSNGHVVIPKGSRIVGHVTEAKARAKGESQSSLGIVFDHAVLKNGQEVPLNTSLQAVAAARSASSAFAGDDMASMSSMGSGAVSGGARSGGALLGGAGATAGGLTNATAGVGSTVGGTLNTATSAGSSVTGALNSTSSGVVGLPGMALNSTASAAAQGSVITSAGKNIHLDSGTQMLLKITSSANQQ